jgi:16S rRNA (uracil1498-N3)-methyltransferase
MKLMVEKCTELGVGAIILVKSDRMDGSVLSSMTTPSIDSENLDELYGMKGKSREGDASIDKLKPQAIEASEQCERLDIPCITTDPYLITGGAKGILSVKDIVQKMCSNWDDNNDRSRKLLICRERGELSTNVVPVLSALRDNKKVAFIVGPEGGWSPEEETLFDHISMHYSGNDSPVVFISLGSSVLRAETACMMAVGAWALVHTS